MYRSTGPVTGALVIEGCGKDRRGKDTLRGRILPSVLSSTGLIAHGLATAPSVSGSPMWIEEGGSRTLITLHERRIDDDRSGRIFGAAVFLNGAIRAQVAWWMNMALPRSAVRDQDVITQSLGHPNPR
jgi:hypothetical protein